MDLAQKWQNVIDQSLRRRKARRVRHPRIVKTHGYQVDIGRFEL